MPEYCILTLNIISDKILFHILFNAKLGKNVTQTPLYAATLAFTLGPASTIAAQSHDPLADYMTAHANDHQALADLICEQAQDHKYIFLGDTNHGSKAIKDAINSPAVLKAIMDCTPGVMVLEGSIETGHKSKNYDISSYDLRMNNYSRILSEHESLLEQIAADPESNGSMAGVKGYIEARIRTAIKQVDTSFDSLKDHLLQREFGVATHFYDQGYNLSFSERKSMEAAWKTFGLPPSCTDIAFMHYAQEASDKPGDIYAAVDKLMVNRLTTDNVAIANGILDNHPEGAVIVYGAGHMDQSNDLDEMVGASDSVVIDVVDPDFSDDPEYLTKGIQRLFPQSTPFIKSANDPADITYNVHEQAYDKGNADDRNADKIYPTMPRDVFDACRNLLTETARNAFIKKTGADLTFEDYITMTQPEQDVPDIFKSWLPPPPDLPSR